MHATDVDRDGATDRDPAGHDVDQASERQAVLENLDHGGVGTEVDDVIESLAGDAAEIGDARHGEACGLERGPLGGVGQMGGQLDRPGLIEQGRNAIEGVARLRNQQ